MSANDEFGKVDAVVLAELENAAAGLLPSASITSNPMIDAAANRARRTQFGMSVVLVGLMIAMFAVGVDRHDHSQAIAFGFLSFVFAVIGAWYIDTAGRSAALDIGRLLR